MGYSTLVRVENAAVNTSPGSPKMGTVSVMVHPRPNPRTC